MKYSIANIQLRPLYTWVHADLTGINRRSGQLIYLLDLFSVHSQTKRRSVARLLMKFDTREVKTRATCSQRMRIPLKVDLDRLMLPSG